MAPSTYGDDATIGGGDISITAGTDTAATLILSADGSADANDDWKFNAADGGTLTIGNDIASAGSFVPQITFTPHATATSSTTTISGNLTTAGDVSLLTDGDAVKFGADGDVTLTHVHNKGLALKHTAGGDEKPLILTLQTGETTIIADEVLAQIDFQAPDEASDDDSQLVAASIAAVAEGVFSTSSNATKLAFYTGATETATEKMSLSSAGALTLNTGGDGALTFGAASSIKMADNSAVSLVIEEADNAYMTFNTLDAGPGLVQFDKSVLVTSTNKITFEDNSNWDQYIGSVSAGNGITQLSSPMLMLNASAGGMALSGSTSLAGTFGAVQWSSVNTMEPAFTIKNTNADANGAMFVLNKTKTGATPDDNDILGSIIWQGADSDGNQTSYSMIRGLSTDVTTDTEDGSLSFWTMVGGSLTQLMDLGKTSEGNLYVARTVMIGGGNLSFQTDDTGIKFGEHSDVTLTHVHNTGLLLTDDSGTGTTKLQFGDSGTFINQPTDGTLGIDADTIVDITAPTVNLEAAAINLGEDDDSDVTLTFKGTNNDGVLAWDESADEFVFSDGIKISKPAQTADMADTDSGDIDYHAYLTANTRRGSVTITLAEQVATSGASAAPTIYISSGLVKATDVIVATPCKPTIAGMGTPSLNLVCNAHSVSDGSFAISIINSFAGTAWGADGDTIVVNWVAL